MTTSAATSGEPITPADEALRVEGACRHLGGRAVLDGVDLVVARGTVVALAGANGAGKTSLLRAVGGRLRLDTGRVVIAGQPAAAAIAAGRVGVAPQALALYPHLTVRENLAVFGQLAGVPPELRVARIDAALDGIGLAHRGHSLLQTLSGGMQRRVHLAAATLHHPDLLLLDEPTVGVDADSRSQLRALIGALREGGAGILVATHDLDDAEAIADRVAVMAAGRIVAEGTVAELRSTAYPDGAELSIAVAPDTDRSSLVAAGFAAAGDDRWRRAVRGAGDLGGLAARLAAAGVTVTAWHLRPPTLAGAVARLVAAADGEARP
ncbi:MAG: ABC transporter ATP-binding protein [Vicinamibacterales bacterium]